LAELEALRAERDELRDKFMRALADAENSRKRADRDRARPSNTAARAWRATFCRSTTT
jgi:molecular chaperone GrpE